MQSLQKSIWTILVHSKTLSRINPRSDWSTLCFQSRTFWPQVQPDWFLYWLASDEIQNFFRFYLDRDYGMAGIEFLSETFARVVSEIWVGNSRLCEFVWLCELVWIPPSLSSGGYTLHTRHIATMSLEVHTTFCVQIGGKSRIACEGVVSRGQSSVGRYEHFARWSGQYEHFARWSGR